MAFSADGTVFAECGRDGSTLIGTGKKFATAHTFTNPAEQRKRGPYTFPANGVAFSPDGSRIAIASGDGTRIMNLESNTEERLLDVVNGTTIRSRSCVAWSRDGRFIAEGNMLGTTRVWDTTSWEPVALMQHAGVIIKLYFGDDVLVSACADGAVRCFGLAAE
jgi:WD40 repeat protein